MEGVDDGVLKMAELKVGVVKKDEPEDKPKEPVIAPPLVIKENLQFKDIPLDMKRLVFSYVRKIFHILFPPIYRLSFLVCPLCIFVDCYVPLPG